MPVFHGYICNTTTYNMYNNQSLYVQTYKETFDGKWTNKMDGTTLYIVRYFLHIVSYNTTTITIILNRTFDICSCLSQSENTKSKVLCVKTEFMRVYERAFQMLAHSTN